MLKVRAEGYAVMLSWSLGDFSRVISKAPDVIRSIEDDTKDYAFRPHMYYYLGRTYWSVGRDDDALACASRGLDDAFALEASRFAERSLFLDYPTHSGYQGRIVLLSQLIADVQIYRKDFEGAAETFFSLGIPLRPATLWSTHSYFSPEWQEYIKNRPDLQWGDFEVWREEIAVMGNAHLLITHQYHYARTLRSRHDPDGAVKLLEEAIERAKEIQASFLAATCGLELVDICTERKRANDKQLALDTLNMVQGEVNKFGVRFLKKKYERAWEVVQSIT